jgi:hypothetical protein
LGHDRTSKEAKAMSRYHSSDVWLLGKYWTM